MKKLLVALMAATMLATSANAAFEKVNTYNDNFTDVKAESWYAENVKSAYELGFMNGKSDDKFDPNGNVTVAEGITMAARVHAIYNGTEVTKKEKPVVAAGDEIRFDFDSLDGHRLNHAYGDVVDGVLEMQPDAPNANGSFDLGVFIENVEIDASVYKTMKVRMKREALENINERRPTIEIFFGSEDNSVLGSDGNYLYTRVEESDLDDWKEYTFDMSKAAGWKGNIIQVRFDPTNDNGKYYIDYIVFSAGSAPVVEEPKEEKWYDMYVDYAIDNGIITKTTFANYTRNATRAELAGLFAAALPAEYFGAINEIKGIPDVKKTDKYAKDILMLYNAGVVLGSDAEVTFNPNSDIKRSEVAAIINRVALPESRQTKDTITAVWEEDAPAKVETPEVPKADETEEEKEHVATPFDVEFNDASDLDFFAPGEVDSAEIVDGALVMVARDRGAERMPQFDPRLVMQNVEIDASKYKKIKIRLKAEFIGEVTNGYSTDIYYMTSEDENFSEAKSLHPNLMNVSKMDDEGWYLVEIDLTAKDTWNGTVTAFRFDPSNNNGKYSFDYIRFE